MKTLLRTTLVLALACSSGCVMWMREPEFYESELTKLLETTDEAIAACYDNYVETVDAKAKGEVVVTFEVEAKTGQLRAVAVDAEHSTAPEPLRACVTEQITPLKLAPPDANLARATYTWQFVLGSRKPMPKDPFADVLASVVGCYRNHLEDVDRTAQGELVVEYAFDPSTGKLSKLDVVGDATTAAQPIVACATEVLRSASVAPDQLDARVAAGRRSFGFHFTPYQE
jgi:hypothetical protein